MRLGRRQLLKAGALGAGVATLGGCERLISALSGGLQGDLADWDQHPTSEAGGAGIDPTHHLLSRAAHGPWPGDVERIRALGEERWVDEQLHPESLDDSACDLRARRFETIWHAPGTCYEYRKDVLREELSRHTLLRAVYSRRQLLEVMVGFWSDHLNIDIGKGDCAYLKATDDREVIRRHALGRFRDLIRASATSPAMLEYLDGKVNRRARPEDVPNENYARELMELHTLGVHGGYTQGDVSEAARALTGWQLRTQGLRKGTVSLNPALHDDGEKQVLGRRLPAGQGGERDLDAVVDAVCDHPSTARFIAFKLVRRLVAEEPPPALVNRAAEVFRQTKGDIRSMVRTVLLSVELRASAGQKLKTPFRFIASSLRAVAADTHAHAPVLEYLQRMGHAVFQYPTPDGYPEESVPWMTTLLWRWSFATRLASGAIDGVQVPLEALFRALEKGGKDRIASLFHHLTGRAPLSEERRALAAAATPAQALTLALSSPAFQRH